MRKKVLSKRFSEQLLLIHQKKRNLKVYATWIGLTIIFFSYALLLPAQKAAPTPLTIPIYTAQSDTMYPPDWLDKPINGLATSLDSVEVSRSIRIIQNALKKYPADLLKPTLDGIYVLKSISFFDVEFGGTNSKTTVYLTNDGTKQGYTDTYIEQTFHHEFSSILLRNNWEKFDYQSWSDLNGDNYGLGGVDALKNNKASTIIDTTLCRNGFIYEYAVSDLENDFNSIAENLFLPETNFWQVVDNYPIIRKKAELTIAFYNALNPIFTEAYFRAFAEK